MQNVAISAGTSDLEKLKDVIQAVPELCNICLDVANGYSEVFVKLVRECRALFPEHTILVQLHPSPRCTLRTAHSSLRAVAALIHIHPLALIHSFTLLFSCFHIHLHALVSCGREGGYN